MKPQRTANSKKKPKLKNRLYSKPPVIEKQKLAEKEKHRKFSVNVLPQPPQPPIKPKKEYKISDVIKKEAS